MHQVGLGAQAQVEIMISPPDILTSHCVVFVLYTEILDVGYQRSHILFM